jgi:peptidoglycan/xylan/chitin deacetylase (PgdA/CDA1 family)
MSVRWLAVVPVFDEEHSVVTVLDDLADRVDEIVIVDDGSRDASRARITEWQVSHPEACVLVHDVNRGVAAAYRTALDELTRRRDRGELDDRDVVFFVDADGQHDPALLADLGRRLEDDDLDAVVARRDLGYQSQVKRWGNRVMSLWASWWAGRKLHDVECGYRAYRLGPLLVASTYLTGYRYSQPSQMAVAMCRLGYRVDGSLRVPVPVARSRTTWSTALVHLVAIPWTALRVVVARTWETWLAPPRRGERRSWLARAATIGVAAGAVVATVWAAGRLVNVAVAWTALLTIGAFVLGAARSRPTALRICVAALVPAQVFFARLLWGYSSLTLVAAVAAAFTAGVLLAPPVARTRPLRRSWALVPVVLLVWAAAVLWSGVNDPAAAWFGRTTSHGPRSQGHVAITFDDGPNDPATLEIARLLASRGVRGTFFMTGAAVDARPDLVQEVVVLDQVVGNHSYRHGRSDWSNPAYPELLRGELAFERALGRCPALFRPPYGRHTPAMAGKVRQLGMHMVTWDVAGSDWQTSDAELVARRLLRQVKPGSIILLHDGSAGHPEADRMFVVRVTELLLDGLAERQLEPVGLDEMLGVAAWLPECPST